MDGLIDLSENELAELQKLAKKNPVIEKLMGFLYELEVDPIKNSYIVYSRKLLEINKAVERAKFDINDKDDKAFDRISKSMIDTAKIAQTLAELKKSFSPEELKEIDEVQRKGGITTNWFLRNTANGKA